MTGTARMTRCRGNRTLTVPLGCMPICIALRAILPNANHWYGRAQKPASSASLPQEWEEIARALLQE